MSNAAALATILRKLADAHYQAADDLASLATEVVANEQPAAGVVPPSTPAPADPFDFEELPTQPQGSLAMCPKHRKPYKDGKFGPFCTSPSDDPAWRNSKGYCSITPKNVDVWLRAQAA